LFGLGKMRSSLNFHIPGLGGRKKMTQMQRCVGMACDTIDLVFLLEKSSSIVLHQDVSKGLLVVTFSACSESLEVVRGFLGCCPIPPAEMESLQKCTSCISGMAANGRDKNRLTQCVGSLTTIFVDSNMVESARINLKANCSSAAASATNTSLDDCGNKGRPKFLF